MGTIHNNIGITYPTVAVQLFAVMLYALWGGVIDISWHHAGVIVVFFEQESNTLKI